MFLYFFWAIDNRCRYTQLRSSVNVLWGLTRIGVNDVRRIGSRLNRLSDLIGGRAVEAGTGCLKPLEKPTIIVRFHGIVRRDVW